MSTNTFSYRARDRQGQVLTGETEGSNPQAVIKALRDKGLTPLGITAKSNEGLQKDIKIGRAKRVKQKEVAVMSRQLATMVNAGLSLLRSLSVLKEQAANPALAKVIGDVRNDVEKGSSLSAALERQPKVFSKLYVAMIKAGESGGVLDETLNRLADTLEAQMALRSKVKSAMAYPVAVLGLVVVVVIGMMLFVVPQFVGMYSNLGGTLPLPTRLLIGVSNLLTKFWYLFGMLTVGGVWGFRRWKKTEAGTRVWDKFKLKVPVFGLLTHKTAISRFSRTLAVLARTGVPILPALSIVEQTVGSTVVADAVKAVGASVKEGDSLSGPLENHSVFPPMVVQMMAVGEETGALDAMLEKVADFYDQEVNDTVDALTSLLEPLMIVFMGLTVGAILVALYLPMFGLADAIK